MTTPSLTSLAECLHDDARPLDARFRALFTLKGLLSNDADHTADVITIIDQAFANNDSALLKHELAYVLGQIQSPVALPCLNRVLSDVQEHPMVRHEAAEAMGAISSTDAIPVLQQFLHDDNVSVRETCELALQKIQFDHAGPSTQSPQKESEGAAILRAKAATQQDLAEVNPAQDETVDGSFLPIDPAPAHSMRVDTLLSSVPLYKAQLTAGETLPLFQRYRAMFSLRNAVHAARRRAQSPGLSDAQRQQHLRTATEAVEALASGLIDRSALFRHEICFVFGELAHPASVKSMIRVLSDEYEEDMVRHEAAEALGAVVEEEEEADSEQQDPEARSLVMRTLRRFAEDQAAPRVVRESCVVALDEMAYNNDPSQFQPISA